MTCRARYQAALPADSRYPLAVVCPSCGADVGCSCAEPDARELVVDVGELRRRAETAESDFACATKEIRRIDALLNAAERERDAWLAAAFVIACDGPELLAERLRRLIGERDEADAELRQAHNDVANAERERDEARAEVDRLRIAPVVTVRDMSGDGSGPWRLFVGRLGVATWPSKPSREDPRAYAEEVARCVDAAIRTHVGEP